MTTYEADSQTIVIGASLAAFVAFLIRKYVNERNRLPYPPGPPPKVFLGSEYKFSLLSGASAKPLRLPFIDLLDMPRSRQAITYRNWGREYGPMTFIQLPGRPILVVNSHKVAVELLDKRGTIYSDRPPFPMGSLVGSWHPATPHYG